MDETYVPFELNGIDVDWNRDEDPSDEGIISPPNHANQSTPKHQQDSSLFCGSMESVRFCMRGHNPRRRLEDTQSTADGPVVDLSGICEIIGTPAGWKDDPLWFVKFIDDGLAGEKLFNGHAISHITERKEAKLIHAGGSERFLKLTIQNAMRIGMKINEDKTKLLCMNVSQHSHINTYINVSLSLIHI